MKIQSPAPLLSTLDRVRGSESTSDAPKRERGQDEQPKKDEPESQNANPAELAQALDEFTQNQNVASNGLQAEVAGQGPGLRVTLKDGRGAVVRQFTGEEFLRLREAASGAPRGRLLDKKL